MMVQEKDEVRMRSGAAFFLFISFLELTEKNRGKIPLRKYSLFFSKHNIIGPQSIFVLQT